MKTFRIATWATLIIAVLLASLLFLVPLPEGQNPLDFYISLAPAVAAAILYVGGSITLVMGFGVFTKDSLRQDIAQKLRLTAGATGTFWQRL